jgi:hypothetical protein
MKKIINILIIICYLQLIVVPIFLYADTNEFEMKVIKINGEKITADKGLEHGIIKDSVFDIKRLLEDKPKYIGMAVVTEVSDSNCCLKTYPLSFIAIKKDDLLLLNERETQVLEQKQSEGYWINLSQKVPSASENDLLFDGKILKNPRIKLKSGNILSEKKYIVKRDEELLYKSFGEYRSVPMANIESIEVSTKNYSLFGALIGTAFGQAAVYLADGSKSIDTTYYYAEVYNSQDRYIGWEKRFRISTKDNRLKSKYKTGIIVSGFLLGALVGSFFDGGWKKIYPIDGKKKKLSIKFSPPEVRSGVFKVGLQIKHNY